MAIQIWDLVAFPEVSKNFEWPKVLFSRLEEQLVLSRLLIELYDNSCREYEAAG